MGNLLHTTTEGPLTGPSFLVLHDRHGNVGDARSAAAEYLPAQSRRILVRSGRTQTTGGHGVSLGYYWYVGPKTRPELSTLGDGLYQLEQLLLEKTEHEKIGLLGIGEGGTMCLLLAQIWPERLRSVIAINAPWPSNFGKIPIPQSDMSGLSIFIGGEVTSPEGLQTLSAQGAQVVRTSAPDMVSALAHAV